MSLLRNKKPMIYSPFHLVGTLFSCCSHFNDQILYITFKSIRIVFSTAIDLTYFRLK